MSETKSIKQLLTELEQRVSVPVPVYNELMWGLHVKEQEFGKSADIDRAREWLRQLGQGVGVPR